MSRAKKIFLIVLIISVAVLGLLFFVRPCPEYYHVGRDLPVKVDGIIEPRRNIIQEITRWYVEKLCPKSVEILFVEKAFAQSADSDLLNSDLLNLKTNFPGLISSYEKVNIFDAWQAINSRQLQFGPINIGIIDSGIDVLDGSHPEFLGVNFGHSDPFSLRDRSAEFGESKSGHGTKVAGIIGANNVLGTGGTLPTGSPQMNGVVSGAKNLNYILESRSKQFIPLIEFGAILNTFSPQSIVNLSLRQTDCLVLGVLCIKSEDFRAATSYYKEGIEKHPDKTFVISAGNNNIDVNKSVPSNIDLPNTIIVGATDLNDQRAGFSNFGSGVDISAPGVSVYAPAIRGKGNFPTTGLEANNYVTNFSGTSASAPMVSGVAGLIKAIKPGLTPAQIKDILIRNADPITTDKPIGGRLNALKAVCDPLVLNCTPPAVPGVVQLTNTILPARNFPPAISQDGGKVALVSTANLGGLNPAGAFALFVMKSDGTEVTRIAPGLLFNVGADPSPSLNSNGSKIVFVARTSTDVAGSIYIADTDGTSVTELVPPSDNRFGSSPVMSSDGSTIVYLSNANFGLDNTQMYAINSDGTNKRLLVEVCCRNAGGLYLLSITGNGSRVAFSFLRALVTPAIADFPTWRIGIINTDGTGIITVTPPSTNMGALAIEHDGSQVAFTTLSNPTDIYLVNADGTSLHLLWRVGFTATSPIQFTTDGSKLMYNSVGNIFLANTDGSDSPQQITSLFSDVNPAMSGDGKKIVFISPTNLAGQNPDGNLEIFLITLPP